MNIFDRFLNQNKINFIDEFINTENKKEFLTMNIRSFNKLSSEELKQLLLNENIDYDIKHYILRTYSKQVKKISNNDFHLIIHLLHSKIDMYEYNDKLNTLNYNEYCNCLENIKSGESLIAAVDTTRFLQLLREEEKLGKNDLKKYLTLKDMYLVSEYSNDLEEFKNQSNNLSCYLNTINNEKINIDLISNIFLKNFNKHFKSFEINDSAFQLGLKLMNYNIKNSLELDSNMLEFYVKYIVKELYLEKFVNRVNIFTKEGGVNSYNALSKELNISMYSIRKHYNELTNISKNDRVSFINLEFFHVILHEIYHVLVWENFYSETKCHILSDVYFLKNAQLFDNVEFDVYVKNHGYFIEENRADLFADIEICNQLNKKFENSFSKSILKKAMCLQADSIATMYTTVENDKMIIQSPTQKFEKFYDKVSGNPSIYGKKNYNEQTEKILSILPNPSTILEQDEKILYSKSSSIMGKLLSGYPIPVEILMKIILVATGEIETTNLYETILEFIKEYENTLENTEERQRKI